MILFQGVTAKHQLCYSVVHLHIDVPTDELLALHLLPLVVEARQLKEDRLDQPAVFGGPGMTPLSQDGAGHKEMIRVRWDLHQQIQIVK